MLQIDLIKSHHVRFCWAENAGCKVVDCYNHKTIGNTDHIPYKVTIHASDKKLAGFTRVVQYGNHGFVYLNYKGQKKELYYDMWDERYFLI